MVKKETSPAKFASQEKLYVTLREKEGRLYSDNEVKKLPDIDKGHLLAKEWKARKHSSGKLIKYFTGLERPLNVLEIGCGNGWFCNQLSSVHGVNVTGVDINMVELEQADRVFGSSTNVGFIYVDIFEDILPPKSFDAIVLGSSLQYFSDPIKLIERLLSFLKDKGEVHIFDSPIYNTPQEASDARERSAKYFEKFGAEEMTQYYNHHTYAFLEKFRHIVIRPNFLERIVGNSQFPWVIIKG